MLSGYVGVGYEVAGQFNPPLYSVGNEDPGNGLVGAVAMLMALVHRQRTGEAQFVENPQLNASMAHLMHVVRQKDGTVLGAGELDPLQLGVGPLHRLYETADGWLCLVAERDELFENLCQALELDLFADERFATRDARKANEHVLADLLSEVFPARTTKEWLPVLSSAGIPVAEPVPYNNRAFLRDPENQRSGRVAECPHPTQGHVRELAVLVRVSDAEVPPHRYAPGLGEHTDAILSWAGYSSEKIAKLRERKSAR
jgi:crotonobetainyl-CoA:carnitine CoA-transferase CaiB-like acyl-CoA transferase